MANDDQSYLDRVNSIAVTANDLIALAKEMAEYKPEMRSFEASIGRVVRIFPGEENATKVQAIMFRMGALSRVLTESEDVGITFIKRTDGSVQVSDALLAAVAEQPMSLKDGREWFDIVELLKRAKKLEPEFSD